MSPVANIVIPATHVVVNDVGCAEASDTNPEYGRRRLVASVYRPIECHGGGERVALKVGTTGWRFQERATVIRCPGCSTNPTGFETEVS